MYFMQLLSRRRSGPLRVRESSARMLLETCKGGQQRLEVDDDWLRLLAAYPALTGESESGSGGCNYSCPPPKREYLLSRRNSASFSFL